MEQPRTPPVLPAVTGRPSPRPPSSDTSSQPPTIRQSPHPPSSDTSHSQTPAIRHGSEASPSSEGSDASPSSFSQPASDASEQAFDADAVVDANAYDLDGERLEMEEGAPEMDAAVNGFAWHRRVMHFLRQERISATNCPLVEFAVIIQCGEFIVSLGAMKNEVKYPKMLDRYLLALDEFEDCDYESPAVRRAMKHKMYRAQSAHTGRKLWDKYIEIRCECRTLAAELPHDLSRIPSGKQLHDVYDKFLTARCRKIYPADDDDCEDEGIDFVMPENWWLRGKDKCVWSPASGIRCFLAVQVHRTSKEIAAMCTSQPAGASRINQRIDKATVVASDRRKAKENLRKADPYVQKEKKARLQVVNIAILEKQNDMISKQLTLFSQNKEVYVRMFTQKGYDKKVVELLGRLPNPVADMMMDNPGDSDDSEQDKTINRLFN